MSDGLGDRVIDLGGRAPIRRDDPPRPIEIPIEPIRRDGPRVIEPREPIRRDEPGRTIEPMPIFPNPNLPLWGSPITSNPPQGAPDLDIGDDDSIDGFYLGDFFIPFWIPIAAIGLWLFLKSR